MEGGALALPEEPALGCEVVPALLDVVAAAVGAAVPASAEPDDEGLPRGSHGFSGMAT